MLWFLAQTDTTIKLPDAMPNDERGVLIYIVVSLVGAMVLTLGGLLKFAASYVTNQSLKSDRQLEIFTQTLKEQREGHERTIASLTQHNIEVVERISENFEQAIKELTQEVKQFQCHGSPTGTSRRG